MGVLDTGFTVSLLHMDGAEGGAVFTDESGKACNRSGNVITKTDVFKFGTASAYFDGAADYLYWSDHADFYLTGDFTIDMWCRFADFPILNAYYPLWGQTQDVNNFFSWAFLNDGGVHSLKLLVKSAAADIITSICAFAANLSLNTWYHFRIIRTGDDYKQYCNGAQIGATVNDASAMPNFTATVQVGQCTGVAGTFYGWIDELRVVNGRAMCTGASYSVPTVPYAPHVDDAYALNLMHFEGPDNRQLFCDEGGKTWTFSGGALIDTAQQKFGVSALFCDGAGDYISTPSAAAYYATTGDFCLEKWVRFNALPAASAYMGLWTQRQDVNNRWTWAIYNDAGTYKLDSFLNYGGVTLFWDRTTLAGLATGTWYHLAWTRQNLVHRFFFNGTKIKELADSTSWPNFGGSIYIGYYDGAAGWLHAWVDEYRFGIGDPRYTANFTPETSAFGAAIIEDETITINDVHACYDNTLLITLPKPSISLNSYWELRLLEIVLPTLGMSLHGISGAACSMNITLPLLTANLNGLTGEIGSVAVDLPLPTMELYGGGQVDLTLPKLQFSASMLVGVVGQLNAVLPRLVVDIVTHLDGIGQLSLTLPNLILNFTGKQHGVGSLAINLPPLGFSAHGLSGAVGSLAFDLPRLKVHIHSRHDNLIRCDIVLPALIVSLSGTVRPATLTYRGVVINTKNMAVTEYQGFGFNSLAALGNVHLAANESGIHVIRGNRQGGNVIESSLVTGLLDFGKDVLTVPRDVWLSMRADGQLTLTVRTDEGEEYEYDVAGLKDALHEERIKLGRGLKGRHYSFKLKNIEGADFDLSKLSILADAMVDRKR